MITYNNTVLTTMITYNITVLTTMITYSVLNKGTTGTIFITCLV